MNGPTGCGVGLAWRTVVGVTLLGLASAPTLTAIELDDVLYGVAVLESGDADIGLHQDGVSYGRYGVTQMAVAELQRVRWLNAGQVDLRDPDNNRKVAALYLRYLKHRHGSWWKATAQNNPRSTTYARRVWAVIDNRRSTALK